MTEAPFTPYWRPLEPPAGPNSWIFFAVAKVANCYHPVAAVSSIGGLPEESLHRTPLTVCCQRIVTIFSDPANRTAIRGELALADAYYCAYYYGYYHGRGGSGKKAPRHPTPIELPELTRRHPGDPRRFRPWDRTSVVPFPFITAALLQGVAFDPRLGRGVPARPEPLAIVYRDTDLEWGMVVVDITHVDSIRYGIVGFPVAMAKFIPSREAEGKPFHHSASFHFEEGPLRVMDEVRPRKALSAAEYIAKFKYEPEDHYDAWNHPSDTQVLDSIPLVSSEALGLGLSIEQEQDIRNLVLRSLRVDDFDMSDFEFQHLRHLPNFHSSIHHVLQEHSDMLDGNPAADGFIRLAYTRHDDHLGLELLERLSANTLSAALDNNLEPNGPINSLSLCIDNMDCSPAELAAVLSQAASLKEICLLQHPTRESDALSAQILIALAEQPAVLSNTRIVFAGSFSSALRKRFWLPTSSDLILHQAFPTQQVLVRHQQKQGRLTTFEYECIHLRDGLLTPEHFAAGFLLWLSTLEPRSYFWTEEKAPFLAFSSAPASLSPDLLSSAQVTPILCENFALQNTMPDDNPCWPRVRDLDPQGLTVLVSKEPGQVRYAFIQARGKESFRVEQTATSPPAPEKLEVAGLKEFLAINKTGVDTHVADICLENTARNIAARETDGARASGVEPLLLMGHGEAAALLSEFFKDARTRNEESGDGDKRP
ncbi:hypothetical protein F4777DRAFT_600676 [Nemania sp. FL0916]|nr:hypothetical protein F4777DRAFT_600676 [Nemania sp. FL0916]